MKSWTGSSGGVDWGLSLERDLLLPGRLVEGTVRLAARQAVEARGLLVTLRGEERWRYETTTVGANGQAHTERRTGTADLPTEQVRVAAPISLAAGETRELPFRLPAPPLGPPSVDAEMVSVAWSVEAKLDIEGCMDSSIEVPVRVAQPVALLRAGVIPVGEFALYPSADAADVADGSISGSIALDPLPLCSGAPFTGKVTLRSAGAVSVRGVRGELRVHVKATVSGGLQETITAWSGPVAGPGTITGELTYDLAGTVAPTAPPTCETPHGKAWAEFVVILDRAWARDPSIARARRPRPAPIARAHRQSPVSAKREPRGHWRFDSCHLPARVSPGTEWASSGRAGRAYARLGDG